MNIKKSSEQTKKERKENFLRKWNLFDELIKKIATLI